MKRSFAVLGGSAWLLLFASSAQAQIEIVLKDAFINKYENRVSVSAELVIDHVKAKVNPASKDGDIHVAARDPQEIQLPLVAEVMNARDQKPAVDALRAAEGTGTVPVTGAWRIWAEHGGSDSQIQGRAVAKASNSNPDHVFEIHPVTEVDGQDVIKSLHETIGYTYKDAEQAFLHYENVPAQLSKTKVGTARATKLVTGGIGYNYVKFRFRLREPAAHLDDGAAAMVSVHDLQGDLLVRKRRMVFPDGSEAEAAVESGQPGSCFEAIALPRLSLKLVKWRTSAAGVARGALTWNLPYEMIVVRAIPLPDNPDEPPCEVFE